MITHNKEFTVAEIAYLAGIIDGEGTITCCRAIQSYYKNSPNKKIYGYRLLCKVSNTDLELLYWIKERFGGRISKWSNNYTEKATLRGWKKGYSIDWWTKDATEIVKLVYPYLIIKKRQATLALKFPTNYKNCRELRECFWNTFSILNKKGIPVAETECEGSYFKDIIGDATVRAARNKNLQKVLEIEPRLN
jgi:hypothetical protein